MDCICYTTILIIMKDINKAMYDWNKNETFIPYILRNRY